VTTIAYPDVSNYEGPMPLQAGTVAVCAKATEGTGFVDEQYAHFKAEAARVGAVFFAYHYLHPGGGAAQARFCFGVVGRGVNVMIDHEPTGGVMPSLQDAVDFAVQLRSLGALCTLDYLPHWGWQQLGSPSLAPLASAGLSLASSSYTAYSDTGVGWQSYGGMSPVTWQWTDSQPYSGTHVDFNAYRGTLDQFRALLGLKTLEADMALTVADANLVADYVLNRPLGEIDLAGHLTGQQLSLGHLVAQAHADLDGKLDALGVKVDAANTALAALKLGGVDLAALESLIEAHLAAGSVPSVIAAAVAKHFGADLTAGG
jgi:hypothetical protein